VWAGALISLALYVLVSSGGRTTHGFIAYYTAARLLADGRLGPSVYDDPWFMQVVQASTGTEVLEVFGPNPPAMALAALPLVWLDHETARWVWLIASLAAYAVATRAWLRPSPTRGPVPPALVATMMLAPAVWANLRTGQIYLFVFAAMSGAGRALLLGRERQAGVALGLILALKTAGAAWLSLLVSQVRFRVVTTALAVTTAITGGLLIVTGPAVWQRYPDYVQEFVQRPAASATAYQTTWGFFRRLCVAHPQWNPSPAADCAMVANIVPPLAIAVALIVTMTVLRRGPQAMVIAGGMCLSLLAVPVAGDHHFVVAGLIMLLIWRHAASAGRPWPRRWVWLILGALYLVPMEVTAFRFTDGWLALAAYPRLYLAWLLWGLIIYGASSRWQTPGGGRTPGVPESLVMARSRGRGGEELADDPRTTPIARQEK
jgi:hypothetical protein